MQYHDQRSGIVEHLPPLSIPHYNSIDRTLSRSPLISQGMYDKAEPLYTKAAEIGEKALGPSHPELALQLSNQGALLKRQVGAVGTLHETLWDTTPCHNGVLQPVRL